MLRRDDPGFYHWMLRHHAYEADYQTPTGTRPPMFVLDDGTFDVKHCEYWTEARRMEYESLRAVSE